MLRSVLLVVTVLALAAEADLFEKLLEVDSQSREHSVAVLPWLLPLSEGPTARRFCLAGSSPRFPSFASALEQRGHVVSSFTGHESETTYGAVFGRSLSLFEQLKTASCDVVVFPAAEGYLSLEAKQAGIAFQGTVLVVDADQMPPAAPEYVPLITRFMAERSLQLADQVFVSSQEAVAGVRLESPASAWRAESLDATVSLLEAATARRQAVNPAVPLVSVIVTSFNRPEMLRAAVASVETQTYGELEIIVVDDGSTDPAMPATLDALERKEKVRVIRQKNQYLGAARNNGARVAKGQYLMFLDDDNVALPTMAEKLVRAAVQSRASVVVNAHYVWFAKADAPVPANLANLRVWCPVGPAIVPGVHENVFGNANFLIDKMAFFSLSGFTEDRVGHEDYEFHARAAIAGVEYNVVPEPLMLYRHHSSGQMALTQDHEASSMRVLRAYKDMLDQSRVSATDAFHSMSSRAVQACNTAPSITAGATCAQSTLTVTVDGTSTAYGGAVASGVLLSVFQGSTTTDLSSPADYSWATPVPAGSSLVYTISFNEESTRLLAIFRAAAAGGNDVRFTVSFTFTEGGAAVTCPTATAGPTNLTTCTTVCFHEDTKIHYDSEVFNLAQLRTHSECVIPHTVKAKGVAITTTCTPGVPLRLTRSHLVYTSAGLRQAGDLKKGDTLFADLAEQRACLVDHVSEDTEVQEFFGLNCLQSTVLANNLKTSTFGDLHTLPALWMSWAGRVFGVERASRWGDAMARTARAWGLF